MSRLFLVDTENTNDYSFVRDMSVSSDDHLVLIYSEKSSNVSINNLKLIYESSCYIEFIKVDFTGISDYLDIQLLLHLGRIVENCNSVLSGCYIVSSDKIFDKIYGSFTSMYPNIVFDVVRPVQGPSKTSHTKCLSDNNINYTLSLTLQDLNHKPSMVPNLGTNLKSNIKFEMANIVINCLSGYFEPKDIDKCVQIFFKTNSLPDLSKRLTNAFGDDLGIEIYLRIKPLYGKSIIDMRSSMGYLLSSRVKSQDGVNIT